MEEPPAKKFVPRISLACEACRERKRKCDGNSPCSFCVMRNQECSFSEKKKRGPKKKKRALESPNEEMLAVQIVNPSAKEMEMGETFEAFTYVDTCWNHLHRVHMLSSEAKIKNPVSSAQKVQAYAAFALTSRLCGNKAKSLVYMNQAKLLAGQIFDRAEPDSVGALLLMSYYSMLVFDVAKSAFYATLGANLFKMIPRAKQNYKLFIMCQLTLMMADSATQEEKSSRFDDLIAYMASADCKSDHMLPVVALLTELNKSMTLLLDNRIFYSQPIDTINVFNVLDNVTVSEETRTRVFNLMEDINNTTSAHSLFTHHRNGGFIKKVLIPVQKAILNWKSGHAAEAMESALACFCALQQLEEDCLYGLLSHFPQLYLIGSLVKIFLEQNQFFLAQQMSEHIKKVCATVAPDLDSICHQMDQLILSYTPPSPTIPPTPVQFPPIPSTSTQSPISSPPIPSPFAQSPPISPPSTQFPSTPSSLTQSPPISSPSTQFPSIQSPLQTHPFCSHLISTLLLPTPGHPLHTTPPVSCAPSQFIQPTPIHTPSTFSQSTPIRSTPFQSTPVQTTPIQYTKTTPLQTPPAHIQTTFIKSTPIQTTTTTTTQTITTQTTTTQTSPTEATHTQTRTKSTPNPAFPIQTTTTQATPIQTPTQTTPTQGTLINTTSIHATSINATPTHGTPTPTHTAPTQTTTTQLFQTSPTQKNPTEIYAFSPNPPENFAFSPIPPENFAFSSDSTDSSAFLPTQQPNLATNSPSLDPLLINFAKDTLQDSEIANNFSQITNDWTVEEMAFDENTIAKILGLS